MGFLSEGEGCGSTFFFELPLFASGGKASDMAERLAEDQRRLKHLQQHQHWEIKQMSPQRSSESRQVMQLSPSVTPIRQRIFQNMSNGSTPNTDSIAEVQFNNFVDTFCLQPESIVPVGEDEIVDYQRELNLNRNLFPSNAVPGKIFSNPKGFCVLCK